MADNQYEVGYAKTAKSGCKDAKCLNPDGKNIDKGSLRIGKVTANTKKITSSDDLAGFDDLEEGDQEIVLDLIAGKKPAAKKNKAPPPKKKEPPAKKVKKAKEESEEDDDGPAEAIHKGRVFAITGTLSMVRKKVVDLIEARGGTVAGSVTNSVTHLIAANPWMMTSKMEDAKAKGIEIVGEDFIMNGKPPQVWQKADVKHKSAAKWQFEDNGNIWRDYADEAMDIVEACYDDWLLNPFTPVRAVKSGDWMYTVNFSTMEQTNVQHPAHTVRKVRRIQ